MKNDGLKAVVFRYILGEWELTLKRKREKREKGIYRKDMS